MTQPSIRTVAEASPKTAYLKVMEYSTLSRVLDPEIQSSDAVSGGRSAGHDRKRISGYLIS
jgi:hypothetical protein